MGRRAQSSCRRPDVRSYRDAFGKMPMRLCPWVTLGAGPWVTRLSTVDRVSLNYCRRRTHEEHQARSRSTHPAPDTPLDAERPAVNRQDIGSSPVGAATSRPVIPGSSAPRKIAEVDHCQ
jgi:hypothetical protein